MLSTPYYQTIVNISPTQCGNQSSSNFTHYQLFCLITQAETFLAERGRSQDLLCVSVEEEGRMALRLKSTLEGGDVKTAQERVNEIISERPFFCVLYSSRLESQFPQSWVREVLPYLPVPADLNPFVFEDSIYANLSLSDNFRALYDTLVVYLKRKLKEWYAWGYVTGARDIASKWNLITVDFDKSLYVPSWNDPRFAPNMAEFLRGRIRGEEGITLTLPSSLPILHNVALVLEEIKKPFSYVAEGDKPAVLFTQAGDLKEAEEVTDMVEDAAYSVIGEAFVKHFDSREEAVAEGEKIGNYVVYTNLGSLRPYVLSILQGFNLPPPF